MSVESKTIIIEKRIQLSEKLGTDLYFILFFIYDGVVKYCSVDQVLYLSINIGDEISIKRDFFGDFKIIIKK